MGEEAPPGGGGGHSMNNFRLYSYSGNIPKITEEERSRLNPLRGGGGPFPRFKNTDATPISFFVKNIYFFLKFVNHYQTVEY